MMISLVRAGTDDNSIPKNSKSSNIIKNCKKKSSKTSKTLERPQKYLLIKDKKKENTANTTNIRLDNILNQ